MFRVSSLLCVLMLLLAGCDDGHDDHQSSAHNNQDGRSGDENPQIGPCGNSSGECFEIGWEGESSTAKLTVLSANPEEPVRGLNSWRVMLNDLEGNALTGCEISLTPYMPDHGHGVATTPVITEGEAGQYQIDQIELIMPGLWEMRFEISCEGWDTSEQITYAIWLTA